MSTIGSFPVEWGVGVKRPWNETDRLPPPSAQVKKEWSCKSNPPYITSESAEVRSRVQNFPAWHTKAAPDGKCCEGYIVPSMVRLMYQLKSVLKWRETMLKNSKVVLFVTLKSWSGRKLFGPYYVRKHCSSFDLLLNRASNRYKTMGNTSTLWIVL